MHKSKDKTSSHGAIKIPLGLIVFTSAYLLIATIFAITQGNFEFIFYLVVMMILSALVWLIHRNIQLTTIALWGLSLWGLAHMAGGLVEVPASWPTETGGHVLYSLWLIPDLLKYDNIIHAYGFGLTTWVCWQGIRTAIRTRGGDTAPTFGLMIISAAAGLGFGALNEVVEFVATLLLPQTNVGGYVNTGWDLVSNLVGTVIAAGLILKLNARIKYF